MTILLKPEKNEDLEQCYEEMIIYPLHNITRFTQIYIKDEKVKNIILRNLESIHKTITKFFN